MLCQLLIDKPSYLNKELHVELLLWLETLKRSAGEMDKVKQFTTSSSAIVLLDQLISVPVHIGRAMLFKLLQPACSCCKLLCNPPPLQVLFSCHKPYALIGVCFALYRGSCCFFPSLWLCPF